MSSGQTHRARKRFGQNFLVDAGVIDAIIRAVAPRADDNLIEIGPGRGALTEQLLARCPRLQAIELDRDLVAHLREQFRPFDQFRVHAADALEFDFQTLAQSTQPLRLVGNLPYNISTPLLFHLFDCGLLINDMHFMLQKEVVERLAAAPGTKAYGRLSIMCQYHCRVESLFEVAPHCFRPAPQVTSAVVRLQPRTTHPAAEDAGVFRDLVKTAFQQRRKTLYNALKNHPARAYLDRVVDNRQARAENLGVNDYVSLANAISGAHH